MSDDYEEFRRLMAWDAPAARAARKREAKALKRVLWQKASDEADMMVLGMLRDTL